MTRLGFKWNQMTVTKTERATRPVNVDESVALANMFGIAIDDLVRPDLDPLSARIQLQLETLAMGERELALREQDRDAASHEVNSTRAALKALQDLAVALDGDTDEQFVDAVTQLIKEFTWSEWRATLVDAGIPKDVVEKVVKETHAQRIDPSEVPGRIARGIAEVWPGAEHGLD